MSRQPAATGAAPPLAASASRAPLPDWLTALPGLEEATRLSAWREGGEDPLRAGTWLIEHGCVSSRDLALAQAQSLGLPFVETGEFRINLDNRALLPEPLVRSHSIFPLFVLERTITLAVAWPLELPVLDQIRLRTGCEVDQCLVAARELRHLIEWAYGDFEEQGRARSATDLAWDEILRDVADAPAVKLVNVLLEQAAASGASDIHIDAEEQVLRVRFRVDGVLREVPAPPKDLLPALVSRIKVLAHLDIAETRRPQDGHFKFALDRREIDVRVSTLPSVNGEAVVLRLLRGAGQLLSLEALGMDAATRTAFDRLIRLPHGMILVTGPTGSGKTTTLYSALSRIDRVRQNLITLEDPVEVRLPRMRQVAVQPKAGLTFASGLRAILRQDPDVIMVGEIRDQETAEIGLQAALTGHLLLSTLHTNSALAAPARLLDMGVPDFLVTSALVGVLAQRLCRRVCPHCARPAADPAALRALLPASAAARLTGLPLVEAVGCRRCANTGYEGRVGIFELLIVTDELRRAIVARADEPRLTALARGAGTRLLGEDGLAKVAEGLTTVAELLRVAAHLDFATGADSPAPRPSSPAAAARRDGHDEDFDVNSYAALLERWLGVRRPVPPAGQPALVRGS
ncbi:MAG: GspE/PulE family protein [Planctomycetota bacterium]